MNNQTYLSNYESGNKVHLFNKLTIVLDILIPAIPLLTIGLVGTNIGTDTIFGGMLVNLAYIVSVAVAWGVLKTRGLGWSDIGLARPKSWRQTFGLGVVVFVLILVISVAAQIIFLNLPGQEIAPIDQTRYNPLIGNFPRLVLMVVLAWTTIAFGEEMIFRAYLINRIGQLFPMNKAGVAMTLVSAALLFGLVHYMDQGLLGTINTFFMGLFWGWVFLRTKRNLWVTIIAHALGNTLSFIMLYFGIV